jgi:hypothetical protein
MSAAALDDCLAHLGKRGAMDAEGFWKTAGKQRGM